MSSNQLSASSRPMKRTSSYLSSFESSNSSSNSNNNNFLSFVPNPHFDIRLHLINLNNLPYSMHSQDLKDLMEQNTVLETSKNN